jgi:hypothetical protein
MSFTNLLLICPVIMRYVTCAFSNQFHVAAFSSDCSLAQLLNKLSKLFYRTRRFIAAFTGTHYLFISRAIYLRCSLILYSHLRLSLPIGLFLSGLPTKILPAFVVSRMRVTCPAHPAFFLHLTTLILFDEKYELWSPSFWIFSGVWLVPLL